MSAKVGGETPDESLKSETGTNENSDTSMSAKVGSGTPRKEVRKLYKSSGNVICRDLCEIIANDRLYDGELDSYKFVNELLSGSLVDENKELTREDFITYVITIYGADVQLGNDKLLDYNYLFEKFRTIPDYEDIKSWMPVCMAVELGLYSWDVEFKPNELITWDEAARVLDTVFDLTDNYELSVKLNVQLDEKYAEVLPKSVYDLFNRGSDSKYEVITLEDFYDEDRNIVPFNEAQAEELADMDNNGILPRFESVAQSGIKSTRAMERVIVIDENTIAYLDIDPFSASQFRRIFVARTNGGFVERINGSNHGEYEIDVTIDNISDTEFKLIEKPEDEDFIGSWLIFGNIVTLNADGTAEGVVNSVDLEKWYIEDNKLNIMYKGFKNGVTYGYYYKSDNGVLISAQEIDFNNPDMELTRLISFYKSIN